MKVIKRVRVVRQKNETGLSRVFQSPRGYELYVDDKRVGTVQGDRHEGTWFFYASVGPYSINTHDDRRSTKEECKKQAIAWLNQALKEFDTVQNED
jgi:hypothetical protein